MYCCISNYLSPPGVKIDAYHKQSVYSTLGILHLNVGDKAFFSIKENFEFE